MSHSRILVAQLGARKHYQEPLLFHHWGILHRFYTDIYAGHSKLANLLRHPKIYNHLPNLLKKGLDRYEVGLKNAKIIHFPKFGFEYVQAIKNAQLDQASQIFVWGGQEFNKRIIQHGLGETNIIYGFNSACLELFEYAKSRGIRCILDQTLADYSLVHKLLLEEEQRWPEWSLTPFKVNNYDLELMEREHREQDLADHIVCGSSFVKDSLVARGIDGNKITVVPLGRLKDEQAILNQANTQALKEQDKALKILFVGTVNLRKGIPYLLEALRLIKGKIPFICKAVGSVEIKSERVTEYTDVCDFVGRISRSQVKDLYTWADVFVLPSVCEGSAMVTYEALSMGVPIITTYNSGSVVRDGVDAFIVPIRNIQAIADNLIKLYMIGHNLHEKTDRQQYLRNLLKDSEKQLREIVSI